MRKSIRFLFVFAGCLGASTFLTAQTNQQLWYEYMLNVPFANSFNLENAFTYSTVLGKPKWRSLEYNATLEYSITPHVDLIGSTLVSYTAQTDDYNTLELRPMLGSRIFFTPHKRIQTRLLLRMEQRNLQNLDTKEWEHVFRPRARAEVLIPINHATYFADRLWYVMADAELLFVTDDVQERFANRVRLRVGAGYRLNYSFRFEVLYMNQQSRNGLDDTFSSNDNIIRIRLKHYLRKTKPSTTGGVGN